MSRADTMVEDRWRYRVVRPPLPTDLSLFVLDGYSARDREHAEQMLARSLERHRARGEEVEGYVEYRPARSSRFVRVPASAAGQEARR